MRFSIVVCSILIHEVFVPTFVPVQLWNEAPVLINFIIPDYRVGLVNGRSGWRDMSRRTKVTVRVGKNDF